MIQTGVPITFRDAKKFASMANSLYLKETPRRRAEFERFALKLVDKSLPSIANRLSNQGTAMGAANVFKMSFKVRKDIAKAISTRSKLNDYLYPKIDFMYAYKNSEDAKFSLKGQTFSSIMKHLAVHSHAIMNHQGAIAVEIYSAIEARVGNML